MHPLALWVLHAATKSWVQPAAGTQPALTHLAHLLHHLTPAASWCPLLPVDGWPAQDHALFVHLREVAHRSIAASSKALGPTSGAPTSSSSSVSKGSGRGGSRTGVMAEVAAMMPQYTLQQLMAHERW